MKIISKPSLVAFAITGIAANSLSAATTTHFIGGNTPDAAEILTIPGVTAIEKNFGKFSNNFSFTAGVAEATTNTAFDGTVGDIDFTYDITLTAIGGSTTPLNYLAEDGNFLTHNEGYFDSNRGVRIEISNIVDNDDDFNVQLSAFNGFGIARNSGAVVFDITPINGDNTGSKSFTRTASNLTETIWFASGTDDTTVAEWTAGTGTIEITSSNLEASLRNLLYSFETVAVPEPGTYALLAGMLGLTCVMLRRRK